MTKQDTTTKSTLDFLSEGADAQTRGRYNEQKAQGVVNPIVLAKLLSVGADKPVAPQMIYQYIAKGKLTDVADAVGLNSTQKKVIALSEANTFAQKYVDNRTARAEAAKAKVESELAGETVDA